MDAVQRQMLIADQNIIDYMRRFGGGGASAATASQPSQDANHLGAHDIQCYTLRCLIAKSIYARAIPLILPAGSLQEPQTGAAPARARGRPPKARPPKAAAPVRIADCMRESVRHNGAAAGSVEAGGDWALRQAEQAASDLMGLALVSGGRAALLSRAQAHAAARAANEDAEAVEEDDDCMIVDEVLDAMPSEPRQTCDAAAVAQLVEMGFTRKQAHKVPYCSLHVHIPA